MCVQRTEVRLQRAARGYIFENVLGIHAAEIAAFRDRFGQYPNIDVAHVLVAESTYHAQFFGRGKRSVFKKIHDRRSVFAGAHEFFFEGGV